MNDTIFVSRREAMGWLARTALGLAFAACGSTVMDARRRYGWEAAKDIPPDQYRTQVWYPPGPRSSPVFVAVLVKPDAPRTRIFEPYTVEDLGTIPPATLVADLRARYPGMLPNDVEVESLQAGKDALGYVIRTRGINVYADLDRSGQYAVRLGGQGKYPKRGGGGPAGGMGGH